MRLARGLGTASVCMLVMATSGGVGVSDASSATASCSLWRVEPSPAPGHGQAFADVAAIPGTRMAWAVGSFHDNDLAADQTLIAIWTGTSWRQVPSPSPGLGTHDNSYLRGVTALSRDNAWAVGYSSGTGGEATLIEHWDGTRWSIVPSPNPDLYNSLAAVTARSATEAWAVGHYLNTHGSVRQKTLTLRWDGTQWSVVSSPNLGERDDNLLLDVLSVPGSEIDLAVGFHQYDVRSSLVLAWHGGRWRVAPSPKSGNQEDYLAGVSGLSGNNIWTVGLSIDSFGAFWGLAAHWDGSGWSVVPTPAPDNDGYDPWFNGVSAISTNEVWAVGQYYNPNGALLTLAELWDGASWVQVPSPSPAGTNHGDASVLNAVVGLADGTLRSVGSYHDAFADPDHGLIERCP